jgi:hypothetical protein
MMLTDYAIACEVDMRFICDSMAKARNDFVTLCTVDDFRRLDIAVHGVNRTKYITEEGAICAANYATRWKRPVALSPSAGETHARVTIITHGRYYREVLDKVARRSSERGAITSLVKAALRNGSDSAVAALYDDARQLGALPNVRLESGEPLFHISGFDIGSGFYATDCFVNTNGAGTDDLTITVTTITTGNDVRAVSYRRRGDLLSEVRRPTEVLW